MSKWIRRHRGWIAVVAIVTIGGIAVAITRGGEPAVTGPTYTTETVERGTLSVTIDGTGYLAVRDEVDAYPEVSGTIDDIAVEEGDVVEQGDLLYSLDDGTLRDAVASARAARAQASQSLERAKLDHYRANASLAKLEDQSDAPSSTVSDTDVEIATREVAIARSSVSAARTAYESAAEEYAESVEALGDLQVTAPCDGIVWTITAEKGDSVSGSGGSGSSGAGATGTTAGATTSASGAPVTIARDGIMGVELSVNEVDVTTLEPGQDAEVLFDAVSDLTMTGTVDEVAKTGTVESGVVSYSVWLRLDGSDKRLRTGMSASATVVTQVERDVLLVSNAAVKSATDGTSYVQVLSAGSSAPVDVTVTTGAASATQTVIESGLEAGARVVTKTVTADAQSESGSSETEASDGGGGILMMGAGGPPAGGPGGQ